jgi:putative FmdB family regulatory protein
MPVYKYRCQSCRIEFEIPQTYIEKPLMCCPSCLKGNLQRIPQLSAVIFKGSGWYSIDHPSAYKQKINFLEEKRDPTERSSNEKRVKTDGS